MQEEWRFQASEEQVLSVALSPDGKLLAVGAMDERIRIYELATRREVRTLRPPCGPPWGLAFAPDSSLLAAGGTRCAAVWEVASAARLAAFEDFGNDVVSVRFSHDQGLLAAASHDGTLRVYFARPAGIRKQMLVSPWGMLQKLCLGAWVQDVAFHPAEDCVAAACRDGTVRAWDPYNLKPYFHLELLGPTAVCFAQRFVYIGTGEGQLVWVERFSGIEEGRLQAHSDWIHGLTAAGPYVLTTAQDGHLRRWPDGASAFVDSQPLPALSAAAGLAAVGSWSGTVALYRIF